MPGHVSPESPGCRPAKRLATGLIAALSATALSGPAMTQTRGRTHEALHRLIPLIDVYDARTTSPEFDVAGIRCAAMTLAQDDWAQRNRRAGVSRPNARAMRDAQHNLTAAEITRRNRGIEYSTAYVTTAEDARRVHGLYTARFASNAGDGSHPWLGDPLLVGDAMYCGHLNAR